FLFTDVEGSTRLLEQNPRAADYALGRHHAILRQAVESHHGVVFETVGDAVYAAFDRPSDGVSAALSAQLALSVETWGESDAIRVRIGLHSGEVESRGGHYFGPPLFRCARLMAIGHGGQTLLSGVTARAVQGLLPHGASLRDMGVHRLKDLTGPEHVFQLTHPDLITEFPALRSFSACPNNLPAQATTFVGREKERARVKELLTIGRLLTLTGAGGSGKTRLGLKVASELLETYPDGVWFVELAGLREPSLVPQTVAFTVGVQDQPGQPIQNSLLPV